MHLSVPLLAHQRAHLLDQLTELTAADAEARVPGPFLTELSRQTAELSDQIHKGKQENYKRLIAPFTRC